MKKLQLCILGSLFAASLQAQSTDYTKGLSIWFDTPPFGVLLNFLSS